MNEDETEFAWVDTEEPTETLCNPDMDMSEEKQKKILTILKGRQQSAAIELVAFCLAKQWHEEHKDYSKMPFDEFVIDDSDRKLAEEYIKEFYDTRK